MVDNSPVTDEAETSDTGHRFGRGPAEAETGEEESN